MGHFFHVFRMAPSLNVTPDSNLSLTAGLLAFHWLTKGPYFMHPYSHTFDKYGGNP